CYRDWSSDVCSSDLRLPKGLAVQLFGPVPIDPNRRREQLRRKHDESARSDYGRGGNGVHGWLRRVAMAHPSHCSTNMIGMVVYRSEERRVGKECRE